MASQKSAVRPPDGWFRHHHSSHTPYKALGWFKAACQCAMPLITVAGMATGRSAMAGSLYSGAYSKNLL